MPQCWSITPLRMLFKHTYGNIPSWKTLQYWPVFPALQPFFCSQRSGNPGDRRCGPLLCAGFLAFMAQTGFIALISFAADPIKLTFSRVLKEVCNNLFVSLTWACPPAFVLKERGLLGTSGIISKVIIIELNFVPLVISVAQICSSMLKINISLTQEYHS